MSFDQQEENNQDQEQQIQINSQLTQLPADFDKIQDPNVLRANLLQLMKQTKEMRLRTDKLKREADNYGKLILKISQSPREEKIQKYRAEKSSLERQITQIEDKIQQIGDVDISQAQEKFQQDCEKNQEFYDWCNNKSKVQATIDWVKLQVDQKKTYAQLIKSTSSVQSSQEQDDKSNVVQELKKSKELSSSAEKYLQSTQPIHKKQFTINEINYNNAIDEFEKEQTKFRELLQKREDMYNQVKEEVDKQQDIQLTPDSLEQLNFIGQRVEECKQQNSKEYNVISQKFGKCLGDGKFEIFEEQKQENEQENEQPEQQNNQNEDLQAEDLQQQNVQEQQITYQDL